MPESDYIIKPVEGLQSVIGLTPASSREENEKRQPKQKNRRHFEEELDEQELAQQQDIRPELQSDENKLDFRA